MPRVWDVGPLLCIVCCSVWGRGPVCRWLLQYGCKNRGFQGLELGGCKWEFPKIRGTLFWGPYNKDPTKRFPCSSLVSAKLGMAFAIALTWQDGFVLAAGVF